MAGGPRLYRVAQPFDGRLAVTERPLGFTDLEDEAWSWKQAGIGAIVSMLEEEEAAELGLAEEGHFCRLHGIDFISCPVTDRGIPDDEAAWLAAVERALGHLEVGRCVAAHCFAGIGRSPLFVASVLVRSGVGASTAWERIRLARGLTVPDTREQAKWLVEREEMLQRSRN